jgi:SAM-dependent methyltransferase
MQEFNKKGMYQEMRKLTWISCTDRSNYAALIELQQKMQKFYSSHQEYYDAIDFTANTWLDGKQPEARDILAEASASAAVLEVGCGMANILKSGKLEPRVYTGLDFSGSLVEQNIDNFPEAVFKCIEDTARLPVENNSYDLVFSHYVIEHCVFPNVFLDECVRALKPGGKLIILCPDFLGAGRMSSQRVGFSEGTGREKLAQGRLWDALVTGVDSRIRVPFHAWWLRRKAREFPRFYINMQPTCFTDTFSPDVDAVYLTFEDEMKRYLSDVIEFHSPGEALKSYSHANRHIYLKGRKK